MDLVEHLVRELEVTPRQAIGGAGLLLQLVQCRVSAEEFVELADTIPAVSDLIAKAPRVGASQAKPMREALSRWCGGLGALGELTESFESLGYDKHMMRRTVEELVHFIQGQGQDDLVPKISKLLR